MSHDPLHLLAERFSAAIATVVSQAAAAGEDPTRSVGVPSGPIDPQLTPGRNPKFGDFQCNAAMSLSKMLGVPPRDIAQRIVDHVDVSGLAEPLSVANIAGPGFINITLKGDALAGFLAEFDGTNLGIEAPAAADRQTIVVDLCGVNLAKQMHVGHIRSISIGDSLARTFERLGQRVIRQNHVGDWGLPIAMVTARLMQLQSRGQDIASLNLDEIETLYKDAQNECAADEKGLAASRRWRMGPKVTAELEEQVAGATAALSAAKSTLLKLQAHDPATVAVWQRIADVTMRECLATCKRMGANVTAEHSAGESFYAEKLAPMIAELLAMKRDGKPLVEESDGALVIRCEGIEEPTLIRKSDGGFLYATTDIAAIRHRVQTLGADRVIYCVDIRQGLHFKQVFCAAIKAGYATRVARLSEPEADPSTRLGESGYPTARLEHAANGTVLGPDNRPYKTRSGENVKLADLLDEAVTRATRAVLEKSPELSPEAAREVAEVIGIAAIKYGELSNDRSRDYVFSFDRMLALEGNTGPYLVYALVRIKSIFRKAVEAGFAPASDSSRLLIDTKEEKDLALALLRYPGVVRSVVDSLEPHRLCQFLYELASAYSVFHTNRQVVRAETDALRESRLRLCAITERVLEDGLGLLGIRGLERM